MASTFAARSAEPARMLHGDVIMRNPEISTSARTMYSILRSEMDSHGTVSMYQRDLAAIVGCVEKTISLLNAELRRFGAIETRGQGTGKPLLYRIMGLTGAAIATAPLLLQHTQPLLISCYSDAASDEQRESPASVESERTDSTKTDHSKPNALSPTPPIPLGNSLNNTTMREPKNLAPVDLVVVQKIVETLSMTPKIAVSLAEQWPQRCRDWLEWLPWQPGVKNPAGFFKYAVESDKPAPPEYLASRKIAIAAVVDAPPKLETAEDRQARALAEQRRVDALLESLPADVRFRLETEAEEFVTTGIIGRMKGLGARDEFRRAKLVALAEQYASAVAIVRDDHVENVLEAQIADDADLHRRMTCPACAHNTDDHGDRGCKAFELVRGQDRTCKCRAPHGVPA